MDVGMFLKFSGVVNRLTACSSVLVESLVLGYLVSLI